MICHYYVNVLRAMTSATKLFFPSRGHMTGFAVRVVMKGNTAMFTVLVASTKRALRDCKGVSATEYAIMIAAVAGVLYVGAQSLGTNINNALTYAASYVSVHSFPH